VRTGTVDTAPFFRLWAVLALLALMEAWLVAALPNHRGYVNDFAGVLDERSVADIGKLLRETEQQTSVEIALVTVSSLDGSTIEEYGSRLFKEWGIGKRAADNGVLVLVAPHDRRVRIDVGYGLEATLPDGRAGEIIRTHFIPQFRQGNYARGIRDGLDRIVEIARSDRSERARAIQRPARGDGRPVALFLIPFLSVFIAAGAFAAGVGIRAKAFGPILFCGLFAGLPFVIALFTFFGLSLGVLMPIAMAMMVVGYRKGDAPYWTRALRGTQPSGDDGSVWVMGVSDLSGSSGSSSDGAGSSKSSFGGGESGGGGAYHDAKLER